MTSDDELLQQIKMHIMTGPPKTRLGCLPGLLPFYDTRDEIRLQDNLLFYIL